MSTSRLVEVRTPGERRLFRLIRRHPGISRVELAAKGSLTSGTVTQMVKRLRSEGWVEDGEVHESQGLGRTRTGLLPTAFGQRVLGVSIRPDLVRWLTIDWSGRVHQRGTEETSGLLAPRLATIAQHISELATNSAEPLDGVGIAYPSFPTESRETILAWAATLTQDIGVPVAVVNNGAAAALAEDWRASVSARFLYVYFGAGIGGALVEPRRHGRPPAVHPAEAGHVGIDPKGARCRCGNFGCVELVASPTALMTSAKSLAVAESGVERAQAALTYALTSVLNILDVSEVVLGGMAQDALEHWYGDLRVGLGLLSTPVGTPIQVRLSTVGEEAAAYGAALAIMDRWGENS